MTFYANSPGLIDDLPKPSPSPAAPPAVANEQEEAALARYPSMRPAGSPPPPAAAPLTPQPNPLDAAGRAVFPSMAGPKPPTPPSDTGFAQLRHAPMAEAVVPYGAQVELAMVAAGEAAGIAPEQAAANAQQWGQVFLAHGVPEADVSSLIAAGATVAQSRPNEATGQAWAEEALGRLAGEYGGSENAERALDLARRYTAAHPALHRYLARTGLGNHPRVVETVTRLARRAHASGKLR